jgi:hypothetical protein
MGSDIAGTNVHLDHDMAELDPLWDRCLFPFSLWALPVSTKSCNQGLENLVTNTWEQMNRLVSKLTGI